MTVTQDHPRLVRELDRAWRRPGRVVELTASEVRVLADRMPEDALAGKLLAKIRASEAREAEPGARVFRPARVLLGPC